MAVTYEPLATTTLTATSSTITFSSISGSYTDLRLVLVGTMSTTNSFPLLTFNSDTGTNYSRTYIQGDGSVVVSSQITSASSITIGRMDSTTPCMLSVDIFSYAGSTNKTVLNVWTNDLNGSGTQTNQVGLWRSTAAITTITLDAGAKTFSSGTSATLYGILKA